MQLNDFFIFEKNLRDDPKVKILLKVVYGYLQDYAVGKVLKEERENCDLLEVYHQQDVKWLRKNEDKPWFIIESVGRVETYGAEGGDDGDA